MAKNKFRIFLFILCVCNFAFAFATQEQNKIDSLLSLLKKTKHDTIKVKSLAALCDAYTYSNPDKAIQYGQQGLQLAEKNYFKKGIAVCFNNIGIVYNKKGINDKALEYYFKALKINEELNDKSGIILCNNNIGIVHFDQYSYTKAYEYYFKALKICEDIGFKTGMAACYNNIGFTYSEIGMIQSNPDSIDYNYGKALEYFGKSLKIAEELGEKKGMAICSNNIGIIYFNKGNYEKALEFYKLALKIDRELNDYNGASSVLVNMGALQISLSDSKTIAQNDKKEHLTEALNFCLEAYKLADDIKSLHLMSAAAGNLQKVYKNLNNLSKALEFADIVIALNDSMFNEKKVNAIAEMEAKYETEIKEKEIIIKNNQIHNLINEQRIITIQIYSLIFALILLLIIGILIYSKSKLKNIKNKQLMEKDKQLHQTQKALIDAELKTTRIEKQKIENELAFKNKEIENLALYISQKNDFLESINSVIAENRIALKSTEEQKKFDTLFDLITRKINLNKDREDIGNSIEQININFFFKLTDRFPDITEKEKRLCALLKLNMSSKEIASILNVSSNTVDMYRYNLRKKFNIEPEKSLVAFLNSI